MSVYEKTFRLRNCDVDLHRRLRLSTLFTMVQEAAIAHTEALGAGREKTLDRGLLWVVTLQQTFITRLPLYDEEVTLTSWPGNTMHVFFPRFYRLTDRSGALLAEGSALWALMDQSSRRSVFPEDHDVDVPGTMTGLECALPKLPRLMELTEQSTFTVPYSYVDLNGHMNNTRYYDLVEDIMPEELHKKTPRSIAVEYSGEALMGETILLQYGRESGRWCFRGESGKRLFRMVLDFD